MAHLLRLNQSTLDAAATVAFIVGVTGAVVFFRRAKRIWDEAA